MKTYLTKIGACESALNWIGDRTLAQAWTECDRGDWMLWLASKAGVDRRLVMRAACVCARTALCYVPPGEDRPRLAIEAAEAWCRGMAPEDVARRAAAASYAAARAASAARSYSRSYAAYAAHAAASYPTAACVADAARAAARSAAAAYVVADAAWAADAATDAADAAGDAAGDAYAAARAADADACDLAALARGMISWEVVRDAMEAWIMNEKERARQSGTRGAK